MADDPTAPSDPSAPDTARLAEELAKLDRSELEISAVRDDSLVAYLERALAVPASVLYKQLPVIYDALRSIGVMI